MRFFLNGAEVATAVANDSGTATTTIQKTKKNDAIRSSFNGDDYYSGSTAKQQRGK